MGCLLTIIVAAIVAVVLYFLRWAIVVYLFAEGPGHQMSNWLDSIVDKYPYAPALFFVIVLIILFKVAGLFSRNGGSITKVHAYGGMNAGQSGNIDLPSDYTKWSQSEWAQWKETLRNKRQRPESTEEWTHEDWEDWKREEWLRVTTEKQPSNSARKRKNSSDGKSVKKAKRSKN